MRSSRKPHVTSPYVNITNDDDTIDIGNAPARVVVIPKPSPDSKIGITLIGGAGRSGVFVSSILPAGLAAGSGLRVGDKVLKIGNMDLTDAPPSTVIKLLGDAPDLWKLTVRHEESSISPEQTRVAAAAKAAAERLMPAVKNVQKPGIEDDWYSEGPADTVTNPSTYAAIADDDETYEAVEGPIRPHPAKSGVNGIKPKIKSGGSAEGTVTHRPVSTRQTNTADTSPNYVNLMKAGVQPEASSDLKGAHTKQLPGSGYVNESALAALVVEESRKNISNSATISSSGYTRFRRARTSKAVVVQVIARHQADSLLRHEAPGSFLLRKRGSGSVVTCVSATATGAEILHHIIDEYADKPAVISRFCISPHNHTFSYCSLPIHLYAMGTLINKK